jgi:hypothetical protein
MTLKEERIKNVLVFLQGISLFIILVGLFLGTLYAFGGNLFIAIPISVILVLAIYFFLDHLIGLKMERKRGGFSIGAKAAIALFILVSIPSTIFIIHALNVELLEKDQIQQSAKNKLDEIQKLKINFEKEYTGYLDYETIFYEGLLIELKTRNKKNIEVAKAMNKSISDLIFVVNEYEKNNNYIRELVLKRKANFNRLIDFLKIDSLIQKQNKIITSWDRFNINKTFKLLDENTIRIRKELNLELQRYKEEKSIELQNQLMLKTNNLNVIKEVKVNVLLEKPIELLIKHSGITFFVFIILIYCLMLLPYFAAPSVTYGGAPSKTKKGKEKSTGEDDVIVY